MRRRVLPAVAAIGLLLALGATGCGQQREVVRVGVLVDCAGLISQLRELTLAAAALPLLERGGELSDGGLVRGARRGRVGDRELELVPECTEITYAHLLIAASRRLIEEQRVDVVVGPIGGPEGVVLRDIAARYPEVTFLSGASVAQEVTLRDSQPNLFRFTPDGPQIVAGLGAYAYRDLGWRRAVVVADGYDEGWEFAAGFVAEFCALGGEIIERDFTTFFLPDATAAAKRHADADGVALFANFFPVVPYLNAYAAVASPVERRLVLAGLSFVDQANLAPKGVDLTGVVLGGHVPLDRRFSSMDSYRESFKAAFPEFPPGAPEGPSILAYYTAVEAIAAALEETGGELGRGQRALRDALSELVLEAPHGVVRLDRNRQATGHIYLERITRVADGKATLTGVRLLDGVEQGFGGIFTAKTRPPSTTDPACERRLPPHWAR